MLDGAPLPANASIRDFRGRKADTVEQALLLLKDMADLRSQRRHEVFLSLKRDLAMVSLSICPLFLFSFFFFLFSFFFFLFSFFFFFLQVSSLFFPLLFLPPPDEGRRREAQCHHGGLQSSRKKNK